MTGRSLPVAGADTRTWRSSPRAGAGRMTGFADITVVVACAVFCACVMLESDMAVLPFGVFAWWCDGPGDQRRRSAGARRGRSGKAVRGLGAAPLFWHHEQNGTLLR